MCLMLSSTMCENDVTGLQRRPDKDELLTDPSKRHLVVLRNGNMYVFNALDDNGK